MVVYHLHLEYHRALQRNDELPGNLLVAVSDPMGVAEEAYRTLRTNLFYALVNEPPGLSC